MIQNNDNQTLDNRQNRTVTLRERKQSECYDCPRLLSEENFQAEPGDLLSWGEEVGSLRRPGGQFAGQDAGESGAAQRESWRSAECSPQVVSCVHVGKKPWKSRRQSSGLSQGQECFVFSQPAWKDIPIGTI